LVELAMHSKTCLQVLKFNGTRISLSMKEVDQATGEDLCPAEVAATGANSMPLGGRGQLLGNDGLLELEARNPGLKILSVFFFNFTFIHRSSPSRQ
jgi:hypothetical protein